MEKAPNDIDSSNVPKATDWDVLSENNVAQRTDEDTPEADVTQRVEETPDTDDVAHKADEVLEANNETQEVAEKRGEALLDFSAEQNSTAEPLPETDSNENVGETANDTNESVDENKSEDGESAEIEAKKSIIKNAIVKALGEKELEELVRSSEDKESFMQSAVSSIGGAFEKLSAIAEEYDDPSSYSEIDEVNLKATPAERALIIAALVIGETSRNDKGEAGWYTAGARLEGDMKEARRMPGLTSDGSGHVTGISGTLIGRDIIRRDAHRMAAAFDGLGIIAENAEEALSTIYEDREAVEGAQTAAKQKVDTLLEKYKVES